MDDKSKSRARVVEAVPAAGSGEDVVRTAGRGAIYITVAKAYFMLTGLVIYLALPRLLSVEEFGIYSVVVGIVSIINAVVITGTMQAVSKYVSQDESKAESVKLRALEVQAFIGGSLTLSYVLLAPILARSLNDPRLTGYFRLSALITAAYSFYAVFTGYLNGRKQFLKQAALDMSYSTMKAALIIALAALGYGITGSLAGFVLASFFVLLLAMAVTRKGQGRGEVCRQDILKFQFYVLLFTLILHLLGKTDLILIKALSSPEPKVSSELAGYYNAVMALSNITYQAIIAIAFVIFPLISRSSFIEDKHATRTTITQAMRFSLIITAALATLFSSNARGLLGLIYPPSYRTGVGALRIVPYGMLFFGLIYVLTAIISSSGRPAISLAVGIATLVSDVAMNYVLIPRFGLAGAATATTSSMMIGASLGAIYVRTQFGALVPPRSVLRIAVAALTAYGLTLAYAADGFGVVWFGILQTGVYFLILVVLREVGAEELRAVRKILSR